MCRTLPSSAEANIQTMLSATEYTLPAQAVSRQKVAGRSTPRGPEEELSDEVQATRQPTTYDITLYRSACYVFSCGHLACGRSDRFTLLLALIRLARLTRWAQTILSPPRASRRRVFSLRAPCHTRRIPIGFVSILYRFPRLRRARNAPRRDAFLSAM